MIERIEDRKEEVERFSTHGVKMRAHFESYAGGETYENGEEDFDPIREEIADHYGVPKDEKHMFIIDNKIVKNQRHQRAFCVLVREVDGKREAYYIDGRLPHFTMLQRLYHQYNKPDDEHNLGDLGFLDDQGFEDVEEIQERAGEKGKKINWFVRDAHSPLQGFG
jgi:hypothetical protein